jgi:hypothetical protein
MSLAMTVQAAGLGEWDGDATSAPARYDMAALVTPDLIKPDLIKPGH